MFDNFDIYFYRLLEGLPATLWATGVGIILALLLAFSAGLALLSPSRVVRFFVRIYVEGFRGSSEVVQLFFFAVALAIFFGLPWNRTAQGLLLIGIVVVGLNAGAYGADIVRGAVRAVPKGQYEAAIALNLSPAQRMWRIILPQAVVEMLPSFNNLSIQLLKGTAALSFIGVPEMVKKTNELIAVPQFFHDIWLIYLMLLVVYLLIAILITAVFQRLEKMATRRVGRMAPSRQKVLAMGGGI